MSEERNVTARGRNVNLDRETRNAGGGITGTKQTDAVHTGICGSATGNKYLFGFGLRSGKVVKPKF